MPRMFDEGALLERVDNDMAFLAETVEMLAADGASIVSEIRAALAAGDAAAVGRHAHALKGMISNFCAAETQQAALEVEKIGKSGDLTRGAELLATLEGKVADLTGELNAFIKARA